MPYWFSAQQETIQGAKSKKYINIAVLRNPQCRRYYISGSNSKYFRGKPVRKKNHRIVEWFGLEGNLKTIIFLS